MQKTHIVTFINAPREKVWDIMLSDATYRQWTAAFQEGSHFNGTWEEGTKMLFLGPSPVDGTEGGMVSMVKANRKHEFVSLETVAVYGEGKEDSESDMAKVWIGGTESYTFTDKEGGTELTVDVDIPEDYKEDMEASWKKGLAKLKEIAEAAA
ncbi:MAG TPA: SRPBCC domain-containing protein [Candidatus Paceibacterota bacterium]